MSTDDDFDKRIGTAESKMKEACSDVYRLCKELQEKNRRLSRSNDRLLKKADLLEQLETDLRDHDRRLCKELDDAETEEEREVLRGVRTGLGIAIEKVTNIGHLI